MRARIVFGVCALALAAGARGHAADAQPTLEIPFTDRVPELADFADMKPPDWVARSFARVADFIQREPVDGATPAFPTEVYLAYDRKKLYAFFIAFDDEPAKIRANLAPRSDVFDDDSVNIMIDTFNDQRRAYFFLCNPLGVQADGQFIEGSGFDGSFEAVWDSEGRVTEGGFIVKIAVPFKSIRFPRTREQTWRVIFNRNIERLSEDNFWPHYSLAIEGRLNQTALMTGIRDISPGGHLQLVPFGFFRDFRDEVGAIGGSEVDDGNEEAVGLDAKFVIKDALVLDVTANPDFSQVEADEPQVTVNQRFEVFFPERRPFFLENSDVFETPTNLFFTRRIVDPSGGVKLTGKQGRFAVGMLLIDDEEPDKSASSGEPLDGESAKIGVLRLARDISEQSKLGLFLSNRELADGYNRIGAVDGRIKIDDNWVAQFQLATAGTKHLDEDDPSGERYENLDGVSYNVHFDRSGTHWTSHHHYIYTSEDFQTDLGFLGDRQRPGAHNFHNRAAYNFRPEDSPLTSWGPRLFLGHFWDPDGKPLDWSVSPEIEWNWAGDTNFELKYDYVKETLLPEDFDDLDRKKEFSQNRWTVEYETNRFTRWGFGIETDLGTRINFVPPEGEEPELADFFKIEASLLWRPIQPLRLDLSHIRTELDERSGSDRVFTNSIARFRANWQFTKELSLRLIADYEEIDAAAGRTSLTDEDQIVVDALVRYLWNPWQALYVGYTSSRRDFLEIDEVSMSPVDLEDEGEQFFVKFSYLFQL